MIMFKDIFEEISRGLSIEDKSYEDDLDSGGPTRFFTVRSASAMNSSGLFTDTREYSSLGRCVFNIYIQVLLVEKDFDISDEAGGFRKVVKNYTVNVVATLEIRLY
ncbi:probable leucine-rich repeat receptor-like serine/threonine-protein kinase [Tanacetum coccineum]